MRNAAKCCAGRPACVMWRSMRHACPGLAFKPACVLQVRRAVDGSRGWGPRLRMHTRLRPQLATVQPIRSGRQAGHTCMQRHQCAVQARWFACLDQTMCVDHGVSMQTLWRWGGSELLICMLCVAACAVDITIPPAPCDAAPPSGAPSCATRTRRCCRAPATTTTFAHGIVRPASQQGWPAACRGCPGSIPALRACRCGTRQAAAAAGRTPAAGASQCQRDLNFWQGQGEHHTGLPVCLPARRLALRPSQYVCACISASCVLGWYSRCACGMPPLRESRLLVCAPRRLANRSLSCFRMAVPITTARNSQLPWRL